MVKRGWRSARTVGMAVAPRRGGISIHSFDDREEVELRIGRTEISVPGKLIRAVIERRLGRSVTFRWRGDALIVTEWPAPDDEHGKPTRFRLEAEDVEKLAASLRPKR